MEQQLKWNNNSEMEQQFRNGTTVEKEQEQLKIRKLTIRLGFTVDDASQTLYFKL